MKVPQQIVDKTVEYLANLWDRRNSLYQVWNGEWHGYHFTEVLDDHKSAPSIRVSHHIYKFDFRPFSTWNGTMCDKIAGRTETTNYRCRVKSVMGGYLLEFQDIRPGFKKRHHSELYSSVEGEMNFGSLQGTNSLGKTFSGTILLTRNKLPLDISDNEGHASLLAQATWPHHVDQHRSCEIAKCELLAERICHSLVTGDYRLMPQTGTETEVDIRVDLKLHQCPHATNRIFELLLNKQTPGHVAQYWACHLNSTVNKRTLLLLHDYERNIHSLIENTSDYYVASQLLRALHRIGKHPIHFLRKLYANEANHSATRAWAYVYLRSRPLQKELDLEFKHFKPGLIDALETMLRGDCIRSAYLGSCLAAHFPELLCLDPLLLALSKHPMRFVREAALLAMETRRRPDPEDFPFHVYTEGTAKRRRHRRSPAKVNR